MTTTGVPHPELPAVPGLPASVRRRGTALRSRWVLVLAVVTLALLVASIVVAVTSGHLDLSPSSVCNASCYR